jgi:heme/copper-type cytochrome/quinol oxidase subunit 3
VLPDEEFRLLTTKLVLPLRGNGTQALGWWGMVGLIAVLFTVLGTFLFSYFYLRLYSPQWPQNGIPLPSLIFPSIAFSILFAGGLLQILNRWARGKNYHTVLLTVICAQITSGIGFLLIELYDLVKTPFLINKNAYSSIYFTMLSFVILLVFTGITMHIVTLVRLIKKNEPLQTPVLRLWFQNSELFWSFTVAASAIVFVTVFLVPYLS